VPGFDGSLGPPVPGVEGVPGVDGSLGPPVPGVEGVPGVDGSLGSLVPGVEGGVNGNVGELGKSLVGNPFGAMAVGMPFAVVVPIVVGGTACTIRILAFGKGSDTDDLHDKEPSGVLEMLEGNCFLGYFGSLLVGPDGDVGLPLPTSGEVGLPLPTSGEVGLPLPTSGEVGLPLPTSGKVGLPLPTSGEVGLPLPTSGEGAPFDGPFKEGADGLGGPPLGAFVGLCE
jgi:hypothetical protein